MAMFFGRFHIVRVLFGAILLVIGVTILYRKNSLVDNYGTSVVHIPSEAIDSLSMTLEEVDKLTRANETCPLCFGRDACDELMNDVQLGRLKVERYANITIKVYIIMEILTVNLKIFITTFYKMWFLGSHSNLQTDQIPCIESIGMGKYDFG